jgi:hypothetical protein
VPGIRATALRWISDEPQPGLIEVEFFDAAGHRWLVHDQPPVFAEPPGGFWPSSAYPLPTLIACNILSRQVSSEGRELVTVVLRHTDESRFKLAASALTAAAD